MGAKGSKAKGRKKTNPYKKEDATTDDGGNTGAALHSAGSPHPGSHTLSGGGAEALSGQPWESKGEPGLRTSTVPQLCPVTMDDSLAVWGIVDFSDRSTCRTPHCAPPRVTLSRATETIDTFVSHVWHDVDFLSAMRLMVSPALCSHSSTQRWFVAPVPLRGHALGSHVRHLCFDRVRASFHLSTLHRSTDLPPSSTICYCLAAFFRLPHRAAFLLPSR
jgi:hypothetical protein